MLRTAEKRAGAAESTARTLNPNGDIDNDPYEPVLLPRAGRLQSPFFYVDENSAAIGSREFAQRHEI